MFPLITCRLIVSANLKAIKPSSGFTIVPDNCVKACLIDTERYLIGKSPAIDRCCIAKHARWGHRSIFNRPLHLLFTISYCFYQRSQSRDKLCWRPTQTLRPDYQNHNADCGFYGPQSRFTSSTRNISVHTENSIKIYNIAHLWAAIKPHGQNRRAFIVSPSHYWISRCDYCIQN